MFCDCISLGELSVSRIIDSLPMYTDREHKIGFENVAALSEMHIKNA